MKIIIYFIVRSIFYLLYNLYGWNAFYCLIFIVIVFCLIAFFYKDRSPNNSEQNSQEQPTQEQSPSSSNQTINNSSSTNANPQNIQWTEIGTYYSTTSQTTEETYNADVDPYFFGSEKQNVNLDKLLANLIGQKDRVTGEVFSQGEKVYFCLPCQLGYHEDSWQFLNQTCEQCGSNSITRYTLTTKYDEYINQGNACYNSGKKQAAIDNYNLAISINPNFADAYNLRGTVHYELGNNQAAIEDYNQAIRLNPNFANAYNKRGNACYNLGRYQAAIDDYNQAIHLNPNYANAHNNRGNAYYALGNNQAAINDYNQAIRLNPNFANAYNNRGHTHYALGNNQAAINDYNQAIRLKPNYTEAKTNLDIARSKLEKIEKPKVSYSTNSETSTITEVNDNEAIRINPKYTEAKTNLDIVRSKPEKIQKPKLSHSRNSETSTINEVYEEYINALNLGAINRRIGQIVTVKGQVASVNLDKNNNIIYFNFADNTYQGFYAYVPASSGHKFPHPTKYSGKTVIISGKISLNRNMQPRMALNNSSQLKDTE